MSTTEKPQKATQRPDGRFSLGIFAATLIVLALLLGGLLIVANVWTDVQWYSQLKAVRVFWTQWGWAVALGTVGLLLVGGAAYLNLMLSRRREGGSTTGAGEYRQYAEDHPWLARLVLPLAVGAVFGAPLASEWRTYVLWLNRTPFGQSDAQFGKDISFYVFTLPVLHSILGLAVIALAVSVAFACVGHYLYGGVRQEDGSMVLATRARVHFGSLAAIGAILVACYFWLSRYDMLLAENKKFSGASFTDINATLPGRTILAVTAALVAALFVFAAVKGVWKLSVIGIGVSVIAGLIVTMIYPYFLQRFTVEPNAAERESLYIQRNIDATLKAYGLDGVEKTKYSAHTQAEAGQLRQDAETTTQIRLLDPNIISPTFNQRQQNKPYYHFADQLSVDRYTVGAAARDTVIGVRELNLDGIDKAQRTWVNDHTVYTHGFGVVSAYGNTTTSDGEPSFFQQGIPSTGELGKYEPRVYFGKSSPDYSVVGAPKGTTPWELDYPTGGSKNGVKSTTYAGDGGPKIGNAFSKLMFAIKFRDTDLFFSDRVTKDSQILYDRDPRVRVSKVAPYLTLDSRVYPAVVDMDGNPKTPKRLVWILDGYTTTNQYPYSARQSLNEATVDAKSKGAGQYGESPEQVNYIRNSVKAVVDAYDGSVKLYQWDKKDPIVNAWSKVFPGTLTPMSKMSGDLMSHMRYPEDMFKVQRTLLSRYHVTNAKEFYSGGDFWDVPQEPTAPKGSTEDQPPYYLTLQMPGQDKAQFSLSTGFILGGADKQNVMTGFLAVDSEAGSEPGKVRKGYGQLRLIELPRDVTVPGPGQAENNFLTDSKVSTTLNLLKQGGTQVIMGNLLTLPIGGGLLYVQPVYVQASKTSGSTSYPIAQYVLTTFGKGSKIGFAPTLEESLNQTFGGDSGAQAGDANVSGHKEAPSADSNNKPKADPSASPSPSGSPSASPSSPSASPSGGGATPADELQSALSDAQKAMEESNSAMKEGNWSAYGEAQKKLQSALERAVKARRETEGGK